MGRQDSPMRTALNVIDPFMNSGMAGAIDFFGYTPTLGGSSTPERVNNQVTYILPKELGGLNGSAAYVFGETSGGTKANSAYAANIGYGVGGLALQAAYSRQNGTTGDKADDFIVGATYDFGFLKLHGGYHNIDAKDGAGAKVADVDSFLIGVTVPLGDALKLRAWYIDNSEDAASASDSSAFAISLSYALSKRTQIYASYVATDNDNLAVKGAINDVTVGGAKGNALAVGVQHNF
jgi:predicted porin